MKNPILSIVILTYRSAVTIPQCLASVRRNCKSIPNEIIVVDNASSDDTVAWIEKKEKGVVLIKNSNNVGFSRGVNQGLSRAKGEYVLFLNPDVVVGDGAIKKLLSVLQHSDGKVGIVGPRFCYPDGRFQASFGNTPSLRTELIQLFWLYKILPWGRVIMPNIFSYWQFREKHKVDWVSGGCLMMRGDLVRELGGFDERFFMYMEDIDLCLRVRDVGYGIVYEPGANITHIHRASFHGRFTLGNLFEARSVVLFFNKWHGCREMSNAVIWYLLRVKFYIKLLLAQTWLERGRSDNFYDYWRAWRDI